MTDAKTIEIKIELLKFGITQTQMARDIGVSITMVNRVVNGIGRSKRVEAHIEKVLSNSRECSFLNGLERNKKGDRKELSKIRKEHEINHIISG